MVKVGRGRPSRGQAAAAPPRPAPPGFFGYGIQIDPWGDRGAAIGAVKNMGFNWVKFQLPWKDFEGQRGQRNWPDDVDRRSERQRAEDPGQHRQGARLGATRATRISASKVRPPIRAPMPASSASSPAAIAAACRPSRSGTSKTSITSGAVRRWMPARYVRLLAAAYRRDQGRLPQHDRGQRRADAHRRARRRWRSAIRPTWSRCIRPGCGTTATRSARIPAAMATRRMSTLPGLGRPGSYVAAVARQRSVVLLPQHDGAVPQHHGQVRRWRTSASGRPSSAGPPPAAR